MADQGSAVEFSEIEQELAEDQEGKEQEGKEQEGKESQSPSDIFNARLEGDDVPEAFRGKSVSELMQRSLAMEQAFKLSEDAREQLSRSVGTRPAPEPAAPRDEMTKEKLQELYEADPLSAMAWMVQRAIDQGGDRLVQHVERRLGPVSGGVANAAKRDAESRYKLEFELFGKEIQAVADGVADKSTLADPNTWDDIVGFVRGKSANIQRYIKAVTKQPDESESARAGQRESAGFTATRTRRAPPVSSGGDDLDEDARRIAKSFIDQGVFKDEAEYIRWRKIGG